MSRYSSSQAWEATAAYLDIAQEADMSLTALSLAYVNSRSFLASNIIGATNLSQLKENISTFNVELCEEVLKKIENVHQKYSNPAP